MKTFKNRPNLPKKLEDGGVIWDSRSVAVVASVVVKAMDGDLYILAGKRGKGSFDHAGEWNLPCGYLDWDENGTEAVIREVYEETGLDLTKYISEYSLLCNNLKEPWFVNTSPKENRQNVALRYGCIISSSELPELTTEHSEQDEVEELQWIHQDEIDNYTWAFNHDDVIKIYLDKVGYVQMI